MLTLIELKLAEAVLWELVSDAVHCEAERCADCKQFSDCSALCHSHQFVQNKINEYYQKRYNDETNKSKS